MSRRFEDLPWHDAVILTIEFDRSRPGLADVVSLTMLWPNDRRSKVRFLECYALVARMGFGVVAPETVRSATEDSDTDELRRIRAKWQTLSVDLSDLKSFTIETNSTASTLAVFARSWEDLEDRTAR